jgi:hypothetical protein
VSAERALPWWASDGPVDGGVDRSADPIERHRAARRGAIDPAGLTPDQAADDEVAHERDAHEPVAHEPAGHERVAHEPAGHERVAHERVAHDEAVLDGAPAEPSRQHVDACGVCPFCASLRLLQDSRPELVEHLTEAARHLAAAARSLLDTPVPSATDRADGASAHRSGEGPRRRPATAGGRLQRIVLDDGPPGSPGRAGPAGPADPPGDPVGGS